MFSRRRGVERSFGAAKDSGVAGGSNRGRVCNSSDDCETRKSSGDRGVRFREPVRLEVATVLRERYKDKQIIVAGDDDHRLENNPGRAKALEAAAAVNGVAIFPEFSTEQREQGLTDFNDLGRAQPEIVSRQLAAAVSDTREGRTLRLEHAPSMELAR